MKGPGLKLLFIVIVSSFIQLPSGAQESSCAVKLREAQEQYDAGQIEAVPGLLHACLQNGFTLEERIQAYKLLINAYIFDDNPARADYYMLEFLRKYPEYEVVDTDPYEFVNLLRQFNNNPRGSLGLNLGGNLSLIRVLQSFSLSPASANRAHYPINGPGFHAGFFYNLNLSPRVEIGVEPMFVRNKFKYVSESFPFARIENTEVQNRIEVPLTMILIFPSEKVNFYARAGVKGSYLLNGNNNIVRHYINTGDVVYDKVTGPNLDFAGEREEYNLWAVAGAGFRYKIPRAYFFFDVRYNAGLLDQVDDNSRNNGADERVWLYYLNQDSFVIDELSVTFGIAKTLYNPKRK